MDRFDVQEVCLNGHQTTDRYNDAPEVRRAFCPLCGEKTVHGCPACSSPIRGYHYINWEIIGSKATPIPTNCEKCGADYPWTTRKRDLANAVAAGQRSDAAALVLHICSRFHLVARQLRARHADRATLQVNDEYDAQDLLHGLLLLHFDDVRPESWTPDYAGGCARVDFLLKEEEVVIEVKRSRDGLTAKKLGDELLVDMQRYREHPQCGTLVCFVYDPEGRIANPKGLEADLSREPAGDDDIRVQVIIVPKGH